MALSKEDHHDVAKHLGKALAKKVSKVTRDSNNALDHTEGRTARIPVRSATPGTYRSNPSTVTTKRGNMKMKISPHPKYM